MDELKEILELLSDGPKLLTENALAAENKLRELIEKTAFVVPKCPECNASNVFIEYSCGDEDDRFYATCDECENEEGGNTPSEAAAAFGRRNRKI